VRVSGESWYPGGAANVARNVRSFCEWTGVLGIIGEDEGGRKLTSALRDCGIDLTGLLADAGHTTVLKTRVIAKHQQVVRVDRERVQALSDGLAETALIALQRLVPEVDGIIVSDYAKGFLSQAFVDRLRAVAAANGKVVAVDPSPLNPVDWSGVTVLKPNRTEALRAAGIHELSNGMPDDVMVHVGRRLLEKWRTRLVLLTLGEEGMLLFDNDGPVFHTASRARDVYDVSGAGDTAIAVFTVALCAGATAAEAAELANAASGIVVGKLGTATVTPAELAAALETAQ
jgi:D-beta-D-heptose 7-phosphate kinase/D-beta-D-heptose 1-phosphate adenosyltransferase